MSLLSASVLVVDDNVVNRLLLVKLLENMGLSVTQAKDGQEAMQLLEVEDFDLVMLDIVMPNMGGGEVLEQMQADKRLRQIPVMMISAIDIVSEIISFIKKGAIDYITKPYENRQVFTRVFGVLRQRKKLHTVEHDPALQGTRILIVDDHDIHRRLLELHLQKLGCESDQAADADQALDLMAQQQYDLVILDVMMPGMDGVELLDVIRRDEKTSYTPVIMISALDDYKTIKSCLAKGALDYIPKPFDGSLLEARISSCLLGCHPAAESVTSVG